VGHHRRNRQRLGYLKIEGCAVEEGNRIYIEGLKLNSERKLGSVGNGIDIAGKGEIGLGLAAKCMCCGSNGISPGKGRVLRQD